MRPIVFVIVLSLAFGLSSCTQPDRAFFTLQDQGYTEIKIGGYGFLRCSEDDNFATNFTAVNANGSRVSGTVCSGLFKGSTIRFD
ncbi:hypothetical phage protein [Synechococcus phage S-CRM01]|uniref:hypothetical protein n=1 Tax=Synechococcus phage S-CRM01 TaxID=1026955 RepID=UPI000209E41F|nr:hypothetical protein SCRM01_206 [Synechococcus phage S-CRM01]AEC53152.1 hypothetical phage protein [Synechococcus phage S-CRM01]